MAVIIRFKRGQASTWESKNLLLSPGEPGFELDTGKLKIGDGVKKWNELAYINDPDKISELDAAIKDRYTKSEIDSMVNAVYRYKGTKENYAALPAKSENKTGDVWNVETADTAHNVKAGDNVVWNGSDWDVLSGVLDLSGYQRTIEGTEGQIVGFSAEGEPEAIDSAPKADKLTTPRTINGAEFDGTVDVNTQWAWNKSFYSYVQAGTYKILNKSKTNGAAACPSTYIIHALNIKSVNNYFVLSYSHRNSPNIKCYGSLNEGVEVKYNDDGVYLTLSEYIMVFITQISGFITDRYPSYAEMTLLETVPADLKDAEIISYQEALTGREGQIVGFDESGNAKAIDSAPKADSLNYTLINGVGKTISEIKDTIKNMKIGQVLGVQMGPQYIEHFDDDEYTISSASHCSIFRIDTYNNKTYGLYIMQLYDAYPTMRGSLFTFSLANGTLTRPQRLLFENDDFETGPKYGVSGVGGSSPTLTRLWDAVGLTAAVGTDTQTAKNDFDNLPPFNRRKCVGTWSEPDATGKAHFTVKAYADEPGYTEDGSMGDYVAVEVEPFYYIQDMKNGIWGVSPKYQPGWKIHPVCINKKDKTVREKTYLPCYHMGLKDNGTTGAGMSLSGLYPVGNSYYQLKTYAHTYNEAGYLEPAEVRNYEQLLFTIEFATTNCQSIMAGATSMPMSDTQNCALASEEATNSVVVTAAIGNNFVVGQNILLTTGSVWGLSGALAKDVNKITTIENCTEDGTVDTAGTYRKITFDGTPRTVTTTTHIVSRPWTNGACNTVKTPSGSLTNNTNGKYPMRYRWRENLWGNLYSTSNDLFDVFNKTDIDYYYLTDNTWMPEAATNPTEDELKANPFIKLSPKCDNKTGAIKTLTSDDTYPYCTIPTDVTGTTGTYYCDNMWLVNDTVPVRSFRFGCYLSDGVLAGLFAVSARLAPSSAIWRFGGGLFLEQ